MILSILFDQCLLLHLHLQFSMLLTTFQALKFYGDITISGSKLFLILIFFLHPCHLHLNVNVNLMTYSLFFRGFHKNISVRVVTISVYFLYFFGIFALWF